MSIGNSSMIPVLGRLEPGIEQCLTRRIEKLVRHPSLVGSNHHLGSQCQLNLLYRGAYHFKEQCVHGYNIDAV